MVVDYSKLKFKCGLEVHQQLDTKKLFCNCPSVLRKDEPDFEVRRKLHVVAGEEGGVDKAAAHEAALDKEFVYQGYDTNCLVELDEEPPHEINQEALKIAMQIAFLMNMKIVPITQIMRKTVIDGSNTSGFQRTVLIARDGWIETENGRVGIESLYLEEDAARIVSDSVYKLDRLGIPLVEVVTAPDVKTPEQAKEVALQIGEILRSVKVKRGLGTIRQDVNVSVRGENRVEIKGMQNMKVFIKAIEGEVERQVKLSDDKKPVEMEVRNVLPDATTKFMRPLPGSARMYPETDLPLLKISRNLINEVKKNLPKLRKEVEKDLEKKGLSQEMIKLLFKHDRRSSIDSSSKEAKPKQDKFDEFKELLEIVHNPQLVAKVLLVLPREVASKEKIPIEKAEEILHKDILAHVLENLKKGKISEDQIKLALERIVRGESHTKAVKFRKESIHGMEEKIMKLIKDKPGLSEKAYMGLVMKEFRGKIDGKVIRDMIGKYI
ncbi:Glu-tRNA(Gln) amidotransferase subunit GatE [Candidatus Pacearchaeota archaeon]|nr:Glu-tRNA(Gln) amidotransferase subunit GatE [Candidatus Pacearchaeota archaeon]